MWRWLHTRGALIGNEPLFVAKGTAVSYPKLRSIITGMLRGAGETQLKNFGGHSFRIGGAQAPALAGRSTPYIMAMGRWKCVESVLTYVETPVERRMQDAQDMVTTMPEGHTNVANVERTGQALLAASTVQAARLRSQ